MAIFSAACESDLTIAHGAASVQIAAASEKQTEMRLSAVSEVLQHDGSDHRCKEK
jgi:hypothetical protein